MTGAFFLCLLAGVFLVFSYAGSDTAFSGVLLGGVFFGYVAGRLHSGNRPKVGEGLAYQDDEFSDFIRFAEFGKLSSGLVHDIANSLTVILLNLGKVKQMPGAPADNATNCLEEALAAARHIEGHIRVFRESLRFKSTDTVFCPASEIRKVCSLLDHKAKSNGVFLELKIFYEPPLFGSPSCFGRALENIIGNALESYPRLVYDGFKRKRIVEVTMKRGMSGRVTILIRDWGIGIPKENIKLIFNPFYTMKPECDGTGLGLFHAKRIIENDFRGRIKVRSKRGFGTAFSVIIPKNSVYRSEKSSLKVCPR